jgi:hypothetical protein
VGTWTILRTDIITTNQSRPSGTRALLPRRAEGYADDPGKKRWGSGTDREWISPVENELDRLRAFAKPVPAALPAAALTTATWPPSGPPTAAAAVMSQSMLRIAARLAPSY